MNTDGIRAEAVDRIAAVVHSVHTESREVFAEASQLDQDAARAVAGMYVDALGDLLPDAYVESRGGLNFEDGAGNIVRRILLEERYITKWRVVG